MTYQIKAGKWVGYSIVIPLLICCLINALYWLLKYVCCAQNAMYIVLGMWYLGGG